MDSGRARFRPSSVSQNDELLPAITVEIREAHRAAQSVAGPADHANHLGLFERQVDIGDERCRDDVDGAGSTFLVTAPTSERKITVVSGYREGVWKEGVRDRTADDGRAVA